VRRFPLTSELLRIFDLVEHWAAQAQDREALAFGEQRWTWSQLEARIRRAAGTLRASGLGPGDHLAVLDKNHPACLELTLAAPLLERTLTVLPTPLYEVYGMTETSGVLCVLGPDEHRDLRRTYLRGSAGRPLPGNHVRVVDRQTGIDVEPGEVGEFWVRSDQVMAGYWNMSRATGEAITPGGWLRTGDVGRIDEAGYLYIEDRVKDMILSAGGHVYPAEVERVLGQHPDVAEVAVIGVPGPEGTETVRAVVVPAAGAAVDEAALIAFTRDRLAHRAGGSPPAAHPPSPPAAAPTARSAALAPARRRSEDQPQVNRPGYAARAV
jgi:acyl-CoA synthetase (AMP-forming)/AMP-acid ligase II